MILKNSFKKFYHQFISLKGDPASLAWGMALGVFIGVTPTIPLHTGLIVLFGFLLKKNMSSAFLGSWVISNPLTVPLLYIGEYEIGRVMMGLNRPEKIFKDYSLTAILQLGWEVIVPLLLGGVILATLFAVPSYFISYRLLTSLRKCTIHEIRSPDSP